ncbi:MAG: SgcJ/EcaC family oxidoreductase [Holophagales bacterium]|nr:SgcJ/EcaC family oxidoreductase [Holophagales bacterium]MXX61723.1 SgcJ/EcaC family oxidoreductase [Holophagales bacterium]MYC09631.1 SgcJ/EcaC family oxidoreductase [Holophagales bacterium]MYD22616.1 SgcJ/EcaC family oxidoreductase [Holophagales bacterium]MYI31486.1 SgcJ/EcaC family oxidoreductase [Holophagales bacterium]
MGDRGTLRRISATLVLSAVLVLAAGCAAPPVEEPTPEVDPVAENEAALNELLAKYLQAVNRGDADGLAVLYTEDAVRINANSRPIEGRDAIRLFAAADYADNDWDIQLHVDESDYSGNMAFVRGTYAITLSSKEDGSVVYQEAGKWMDLMRRGEDGSWLIAREMSNRDHPPGEAPEAPAEEG